MVMSLDESSFKEAARFCEFCRNYCLEKKIYDENVYTRQALVFL